MELLFMRRFLAASLTAVALIMLCALPAMAGGGAYRVHKLVSDQPGHASHTDANLVNGWGISAGPTTPWWVSDEGTDYSTLYQADGTPIPLVVTVNGGPTGTVYNGSSDFVVSHKGKSGPALFLFATGAGKLKGWNPDVNSTRAFTVASRSGADASYTGLAINRVHGNNYLYAADFANKRVDVYDGAFVRQHWVGAFHDPGLPNGYTPFGIQAVDGLIFVAYAEQDPSSPDDEVQGPHLGVVDEYSAGGDFIARVASGGPLNAPWGIAWAPDDFGPSSGDLLVGNLGNGKVAAYRLTGGNWQFDGVLRRANGDALKVDGLWGIGFGNGAAAGDTNVLYFAAGPKDETHGLFGSITAQ